MKLPVAVVIASLWIVYQCHGQMNVDFHQKSIKMVHNYIKLINVNKSIAKNAMLTNQKFNRTTRTFGGSFELLRDLGNKLMVTVKCYKHTANEFKLFAPFKLYFNFCDALRKDSFGLKSLTTTNGNLTLCPLKKGPAYFENWVTDDRQLPQFLITGRYRIEIELLDDKEWVFTMMWEGSLEYIKKV